MKTHIQILHSHGRFLWQLAFWMFAIFFGVVLLAGCTQPHRTHTQTLAPGIVEVEREFGVYDNEDAVRDKMASEAMGACVSQNFTKAVPRSTGRRTCYQSDVLGITCVRGAIRITFDCE